MFFKSPPAKKTVLIVDDARATRRLFRNALEGSNVVVIEAEDGVDALEKVAAADKIDVAMVDWHMPRMNGLELLKKLRADSAYDGIKVLMVTAESDLKLASSALSSGATDYLIKPFSKKTLMEKLSSLGIVPE